MECKVNESSGKCKETTAPNNHNNNELNNGEAVKDAETEGIESDKENHKNAVIANRSSSLSSSTPLKQWLQTMDHRHLTYDEVRSANRAKVMMHAHNSHSKVLNAASSSSILCGSENGDEHGCRSGGGGSSRLTNLNRRSMGSSMGGRGRGWGSTGKSTSTSPRYTVDKNTPLLVDQNEGSTMSRRHLVDSHDHDTTSNHDNSGRGGIDDQRSVGDDADNFPVELFFDNPDSPVR